ncbi:hypothetical protein HMPREF9381_1838 [Streptococcus sanguinis SK72]|uniref:PrgI family protein n=1 Tax=Streptococcus sanguinis SK72 TaxID=888809 RepID=F0I3U8_STRSA|nr:hypothetical protein HMPREF9381_1838 [Streptococcus sanguinis SK72]
MRGFDLEKLGSEFLKEFGDYERPVFLRRTLRQLVMTGGIVLGVALGVLLNWLGFPDVFNYLVTGIIIGPSFLYGTKKNKILKERLIFQLINQKRSYMTEYGGEETKHYEFTQSASVQEADGPDSY